MGILLLGIQGFTQILLRKKYEISHLSEMLYREIVVNI